LAIPTAVTLIKKLAKDHVWSLAAGLAALLGVDLMQLMVPRLIKTAVDLLTLGEADSAALMRQAFYILALAVGMAALRFVWRPCLMGFARVVEKTLRSALFNHLQILHLDYFKNNPPGELMARATNDLNDIRMAAGIGMVAALDGLVIGLCAFGFMLYISPVLTLVAVIPMPLIAFMTRYMTKRLHKNYMKSQERFSGMTEMAREVLAGVKVVKLFALYGREQGRLAEAGREYMDINLTLARYLAIFWPGMILLTNLSLALILGAGGPLAVWGSITPGDFVAFAAYLSMLTWPMMALGWMLSLLQRAKASLQRVDQVLGVRPLVVDPDKPGVLDPRAGKGVEIKDLSFSYPGGEKPVFKGLSLKARTGRATAIVGRIGCGKTTLLSLMARLYNPPTGSVLVEGGDVLEYCRADLRRHLVLVPQTAFIFSATVRANLALGKPDAGDEELWQALESTLLNQKTMQLPLGLDTQLGERGHTLSGGQRQRLALARALLMDPPILALDDPLSEVDTETESAILQNLAKLRKGRTTIMISHRLKSVAFASTIYVIDQGRVVQQGGHEELLALPGLYHDLFSEQVLMAELEGA
jgi:ATP-binding cassette subfamily B multidrug efflux pump